MRNDKCILFYLVNGKLYIYDTVYFYGDIDKLEAKFLNDSIYYDSYWISRVEHYCKNVEGNGIYTIYFPEINEFLSYDGKEVYSPVWDKSLSRAVCEQWPDLKFELKYPIESRIDLNDFIHFKSINLYNIHPGSKHLYDVEFKDTSISE